MRVCCFRGTRRTQTLDRLLESSDGGRRSDRPTAILPRFAPPIAPADVYFGMVKEVLPRREDFKRRTLEARRRQHIQALRMAA